MTLDQNLKKLIEEYGKQQNQHPFLLVDLSGGKENTHTNILFSLLRFNDYMFFGSFLKDVLNVPDWDRERSSVLISTQKRAVGLKRNKNTTGFIDLYIKYFDNNTTEQIIVIENKINGATDTEKQILRYIASVKDPAIEKPADFDMWENEVIIPSKNDPSYYDEISRQCLNRHFVYLTSDGSKDPDEQSLPPFLRDGTIIDYNPISYQDNVLPWLKDTVLRRCPYHDDGIVVAGLRQYIASLEGLLSKNITISSIVNEYVNGIVYANNTINGAYKSLWKSIDDINEYSNALLNDNEKDTCYRLSRELKKAAEERITKNSVPEGWALHLSPTLLVLYRPEWMRIAQGSYSIPFVNLYVKPDSFLEGGTLSWQLHIEHFSPEVWAEWDELNNKPGVNKKFSPTNHKRTACYKLGQFDMDGQDADSRKKHIGSVIAAKDGIITIIDEVVGSIDSNKMKYKNDKEVRIELFKQLANRLPQPMN